MRDERAEKEELKGGGTVWLTGLSASGKSTISHALEGLLRVNGRGPVYVIDGDTMRRTINKDLGFTRADRNVASERIAFVTRILNDNGITCIVNNISQDNRVRERVRRIIGNFTLIFVDTPLEVCMKRDYKGHYEKALRGEMTNVVGIDEVYERPEDAEVCIDTTVMDPGEAAEVIYKYLLAQGSMSG
jgi:adenylyl-sulfate kinase